MTLSETAQLTKKIMVYVAIGFVIILAIWGGIAYYLSTIPIPVTIILPTKGFGYLPKPALPKSKLTSSSVTYDLDTETGALPDKIPELIKVYAIPKVGVTFASPSRAKSIANGFDFKNGPNIVSPTIYKYHDDKGGELIYALDTGNFRFRRPVATKSADYQDQENLTIENESTIVSNFKKYLAEQGAMPSQLFDGKFGTAYNNSKVSEATEAAVLLWQQEISEGEDEKKVNYPIVTPEFKEGLVRGTVTRYQTPQNKYLAVDYIFWQIDTQRFETYPMKTVQQAFDQLKSGEGVTILPYTKSNVAIEKVYLAYYLPKEYVPYLQPVYVFEGPQFAAYVPALTPENFEP